MDLEVMIVDLESHSLNDFGILTTGEFTVFFGLGPGDDHFSTAKNEACGFGVTESHDNCSKAVGVVLCGLAFPCDFFKVELAA